jgi:Tol biopolymer transport system component
VALPDRTLYVHGVLGQFPAVLPDGDIVSSFSLFGEPAALQLSRIDASDQRELFSMPEATVWAPTVARDAGWIVVSVGPPASPGADVDLWKLRVDGTDARNLTPDSSSTDSLANVSADGRRIVFRAMVPTADGGAAREIHVMDGDGGNRHRLDVGPGFATMPALSPDGEWVVYATTRAGRGVKLWIQPVDGGDGRLLEPERADIPDVSMHPRFSPDGQWVVFTSDRGHMNDEWLLSSVPQPYGDLYAVRVTGGPAVRLTDDKWEDGPNDWGFVRPIE